MHLRQMFKHRRTWHVLVGAPLLACVLLVSGCSTRFIYNRLDTLAVWYFESLVSLNDGQRTELRAWLERTLAWHRRSELNRYADFVKDVSATLAAPSAPETHESLRVRFQGLIDSLMSKTAPEASELLLHLTPKQVDELIANLEKQTRESTEESAEAIAENEWRPRQTKDFLKQMKRWAGSVTPQQKELIAATVAELEPTHEDWAESQRAWREALREALSQSSAAPRANADDRDPPRVRALLADPDRQWTQAYSEKVTRNRGRYQKLLMSLDTSLTVKQREHLRNELDRLAETLSRLAST